MAALLTITDAAWEIGIGRRTVQRYLGRGMLRWHGEEGAIRKGKGIRIEELRKVHAASKRKHGNRRPKALSLFDYLPDLDEDAEPQAGAGCPTRRDQLLTTLTRLAAHIRREDVMSSDLLLEALRTLVRPAAPNHLFAARLLGRVELAHLLHPALHWLAGELLEILHAAPDLRVSKSEEDRLRYEAVLLSCVQKTPPTGQFVLRRVNGQHYLDFCTRVEDKLSELGYCLPFPLSVFCRDASQGRPHRLGKQALPGENKLLQALLAELKVPIEQQASIDPVGLLRAARNRFEQSPTQMWLGMTLAQFDRLLHGVSIATATGSVLENRCRALKENLDSSHAERGSPKPIPAGRLARFLGLPRRVVERALSKAKAPRRSRS